MAAAVREAALRVIAKAWSLLPQSTALARRGIGGDYTIYEIFARRGIFVPVHFYSRYFCVVLAVLIFNSSR